MMVPLLTVTMAFNVKNNHDTFFGDAALTLWNPQDKSKDNVLTNHFLLYRGLLGPVF